ncbi:MAG: zf-HC2 domain-containing protein [Spirochaetes bacterium]|nr:zf-HC2 domain-containing protein [Spirochaetota bacterium]
MKCRDARIMLADYAANALTNEEHSLVETHLSVCADCREELAFLKEYRARIASYPVLGAPGGFLASIHGRLHDEKRRSLAGRLFLPLRVKLPLHAAGILAMSILAIIAVRPLLRDGSHRPAEAPVAVSTEEGGSSPSALKEREARDHPEVAATERRKEKISVTAPAPGDAMVGDSAPVNTAGVRTEIPAGPILYLARATQPAPVSPAMDSFRASKSGAPTAKQFESALMDEREARREDSDRITALARSLGGTVRETEAGTIIAEIPVERYADFLAGLRSGWSVREAPGSPTPPASGMMSITMHLND